MANFISNFVNKIRGKAPEAPSQPLNVESPVPGIGDGNPYASTPFTPGDLPKPRMADETAAARANIGTPEGSQSAPAALEKISTTPPEGRA